MGITIGPEANAFAARQDEARIERLELGTQKTSKNGRTARLYQRILENKQLKWRKDFYIEQESPITNM